MKKKYWIILLIIVIGISGIFFYKNRVKNSKIGNNKTSQEIVDYILNISSYEVNVTVNVTSNKNSNKYILKQTYQEPNKSTQEVYFVVDNNAGNILYFEHTVKPLKRR